MLTRRLSLTVLATLAALYLAGCGDNKPTTKGDGHQGHTHTHAGPHKGHVMEIGDKGDHHAEWTHDEGGKITFYILDSKAEKEAPIAASEITIDAKIGDNPPTTYKLTAVNPMDGKTAAFELTDKNLEGVLDTVKSPGVTCTLHVKIDDKQYDAEVKEIEYGEDHKHAH